MPEKDPVIVNSTPTQNIKPAAQRKILILAVIAVVLIGLIMSIVIYGMYTATNPNPTNNNQGFSYLPNNICPDSTFNENGMNRADYQGKPYVLTNEQVTWINNNCKKDTPTTTATATVATTMPSNVTETEPPLLLKSVGFNLGAYNSSTNTAGDIQFTKTKLPFDQIFSPYGQQDPRTTDSSMINPQPVVILPLGTKVLSLVDGVVVEKKELYSGDWTVWVAKSTQSQYFYETEHIKNPSVNVGETVKAGQVLGEVSDYDSKNNPGFGLVEIGILHSTGPGVPEHVCPYKYLDPSIKDTVNSNLMSLYTAWEEYLGKDVYKQETFVSAGCVVETPVRA